MKISVLTLFPEMFETIKKHSIIGQAINSNKFTLEIINFRDFSTDKHKKVDDYQYGGGPGMVLSVQPIVRALESIRTPKSKVVLLSPQGQKYDQTKAQSFSSKEHIILICGHYEGFDKRIENYIDMQISIGDYVLTGGEIPALAIIDSVVRLIDGVISKESLISESFNNDLLDHDVYTKPESFDGHSVPKILLSGNHKKILEFRKSNAIAKTKKMRTDLYKKYIKK